MDQKKRIGARTLLEAPGITAINKKLRTGLLAVLLGAKTLRTGLQPTVFTGQLPEIASKQKAVPAVLVKEFSVGTQRISLIHSSCIGMCV